MAKVERLIMTDARKAQCSPFDRSLNKSVDDSACRIIFDKMHDKLLDGRDRNKGGWWSKQVISEGELYRKMQKAAEEENYVLVATYAAMLHMRKESR